MGQKKTAVAVRRLDKTKVAKLVVDEWFVDKGRQSPDWRDRLHPRQRRARRRSRHDRHRRVGAGRERRCSSSWWFRARRASGYNAWKEERDTEKASTVAQQVRLAAALTAELGGQCENKVMCDQPRGLRDEPQDHPAGHEQPVLFGREQSSPSRAKAFSQPTQASSKEVPVDLGRNEVSMRQKFTNLKLEELRRTRDDWRMRGFEREFKQNVIGGSLCLRRQQQRRGEVFGSEQHNSIRKPEWKTSDSKPARDAMWSNRTQSP